MKMMYGKTPIKSLNIKHYEMNTNDCTMVASDLQAGVTAVARGQKITGTGKSFEFAQYGQTETNMDVYIPTTINVIQIGCVDYPIQSSNKITETKNIDFTSEQTVATLLIDSEPCPVTIVISGNIMSIKCNKTVNIQFFYGKDNYT